MTLRRARRRIGGSAVGLGMLLAAGLAGCGGPIEGFRSLTGHNKNDPDPATAPFTANLEQGETIGYPNLASVPPPPTVTSTVAERQTLSQNLATERTNVQKPDASGKPGSPASGPVPPPPPIPPELAALATATAPPSGPTKTPGETKSQLRNPNEPPLPAPLASPLQTPEITGLPGAEPSRPAPPTGRMAALPAPAPSNIPQAAIQSGNPQPAPPPAALPTPQPSPEAMARPAPKLPPVGVTAAALDVPPNASTLSDGERARLAQVVAQYQQQPRTVRVVSYATAATGSAEQLNSFRAALDRGLMIAKELTAAGIPVNKIQTTAAPASATMPPGRIEVQFLP